jgi:hypothetical protein
VGLSHKPGVLSIHFGKMAAYDALSENKRFSAWLKFVPDGIARNFRLFPAEICGKQGF